MVERRRDLEAALAHKVLLLAHPVEQSFILHLNKFNVEIQMVAED
jgi:hypothetical protein